MTGHIYRYVILEQHIRLFRGTMGAEFLFMDDSARPHHANIVDESLQAEDITGIDLTSILTGLEFNIAYDRAFERYSGPDSCLHGVVPLLPCCRVRRKVVDDVWPCLIPLATPSAGTQRLHRSLLVGVEGNQAKPCFVYEAPGEPGVFPVGDEVGDGWSNGHTVHRLSLRGGCQHLRGLQDLKVFVERTQYTFPIRGGEGLISERDRRSSICDRPGHLLARGGHPGTCPCVGELIRCTSILSLPAATQVARTVAICGCSPNPVADSPGQLAHCLHGNLLVPRGEQFECRVDQVEVGIFSGGWQATTSELSVSIEVMVGCVGREGEDVLDFAPRSNIHLLSIHLAELGRPHRERQGGEKEGLNRINLLPLGELRGGQLL
ncbi:uncharacterized protein TNCV_3382901 [Trichonephila clavipes]|nr:uncharacterized protein TNCV_3382901 [Trichonephila clavipes]